MYICVNILRKMITSNMQIYKGSVEAFALEASNECHSRAMIESTLIGNIPAVKYSVVFTTISNISGIPCVLNVLIGSTYSQDTASNTTLSLKQKRVVDTVVAKMKENTWVSDSMVTTGDGFSITESEVVAENK